ncbi:hypothetical protein DID88_004668 [Monilinia fructigena]|uniref:Major facilitator superfamily (MFS) profile domain-containing protein n=1 Tax=Monilinia fructigena TaxID=38457 RepID=A0A395IRY1_9HELO|nr:hypothetical protein DID88_004668 [Monilinia fructigena]
MVAQDPTNYEDIKGENALNEQEIECLRDEILHKWKQPWALYITIITCSIGAAVQGWDQTGSNGANLSFPDLFGIGGNSTRDTINSRCSRDVLASMECLWDLPRFLRESNSCQCPTHSLASAARSAFIPAVPLCVLIFYCPESPRWYMKKGRYLEAYQSLLKLRNNPIQATRDLYYIHSQLELEAEIVGKSYLFDTVYATVYSAPVEKSDTSKLHVMLAQQMCGINVIAFYSSTVFQKAGAGRINALLASWGFGLINFIFAWPAIWTIDTYGRRTLLLFTFPNMAWSILAVALCSLIPETSRAHLGLMALFIYVYGAFYSPGEGPVPFTYSAEVFPLSHREVGMGWAVATNLFWAAVLGITLPRMLDVFTVAGTFGFYAGLNVISLCMIFLWVPETKQRTIEELNFVFAVPTRTHIHYQLTKALPWWTRRYIFRQRHVTLEPLYDFEKPIGQREIDELHKNDRLRAHRRQDNEVIVKHQKINFGGGNEALKGRTPIGMRDFIDL